MSCMNKYILLTLVIIIFHIDGIQAKSDFRDGYIITINKDTIFGKINYGSESINSKLCIFKTATGTTEYTPAQIFGYGFVNDRYFSSQILKDRFVEVLVEGEINLYKSGYDLYVQKTGNEPILLESRMIRDTMEAKVTGGTEMVVGYREDLKWKQILSFLTSDCTDSYEAVQLLSLNEKDLTTFAIDYNKCKRSKYIHHQAIRPRFIIDYGVYAGLVSSTLRFKNIPGQFSQLANVYQSRDPSPGLLFAISSPGISERSALQIELYYIRTSFYSQIVKNNGASTGYYETYIDFSEISVPLSLRYKIPLGNSSVFFNAGADLAFISDKNSRVNREMLTGSVVDTYLEKVLNFNTNTIGYWGDTGFLKSFKSFCAGITLKYYHTGNMISNNEFTSDLNRISISLILLSK